MRINSFVAIIFLPSLLLAAPPDGTLQPPRNQAITADDTETIRCELRLLDPSAQVKQYYARLLAEAGSGLVATREIENIVRTRDPFELDDAGPSQKIHLKLAMSQLREFIREKGMDEDTLNNDLVDIARNVLANRVAGTGKAGVARVTEKESLSPHRTIFEVKGFISHLTVRTLPDGRAAVVPSGGKHQAGWVLNLSDGKVGSRMTTWPELLALKAVSPDGKYLLASERRGRRIIIWNSATGARERFLEQTSGLVHSITVSPDGRYIVAGVDDHGIAVWDWNGGNSENASPVMIEHRGDAPRDAYPIALRVMPDNRTLLVKLANGSFETWDIQNGEYLGEPAAAPSRQANFVFSEDGTMGVGISFDGILRVVDLGGGRGPVREVAIPLRPTTRENPPIALTADNRYAAVALDGGLWIVDVENQKVFQLAEEPRPQGAVLDLTFTKDGKHLVTVTAGRNVETWDVEQLVELNTN